jgi:hypothetical protein
MAEISGGYRKTFHLDLVLNEEECEALMKLLLEHSEENVENSSTIRPQYGEDNRLFYCIYCHLKGLKRL